MEMWEDLFEVYECYGDDRKKLLASNMSISDATLFVKALFAEYFNESIYQICRQKMTEK